VNPGPIAAFFWPGSGYNAAMRFTLFTLGSRGDTQPYMALGRALQAQGQSVTLCGPENFGPLVRAVGLGFAPLPWDTQEALKDKGLRERLLKDDALGFFLNVRDQVLERKQGMNAALIAAARDADVLVGASTTDEGLTLLGRALGKSVVYTELSPLTPSSAYASIVLGPDSLGPLNYLSHWVSRQAWWRINRPAAAALIQALPAGRAAASAPLLAPSLKALASGAKILHGFSPALFPTPVDWKEASHYAGGAWRLERADAQALPGDHHDAGFAAWLEDGPPPIYLGFGSMPAAEGGDLLELAGDVAEILDLRVVLGMGWSAAPASDCELPEGVAISADCDHGWLFDRCCAVAHHGGAGTTHAAAAAGLPQVVCPFFGDQPFWARRVRKAGAGRVLPFRRLGAEALARALASALEGPCQEAAASLAAKIQAEPGAAGAALRMMEWCRA
jgi:sterol 3beta-glucosyltransferase